MGPIRGFVRTAALAAVLAPVALPGAATGVVPGAGSGQIRVERGADGLTTFTLPDGHRLSIHGYEPRTPYWLDPPAGTRPSHGTGMAPGDPERAPVCATDYYQHVLYARVGLDRYAVSKPRIQSAVRRMNYVLDEEAMESGNKHADFKVLCDATGAVRVDSFVAVGTEFETIVQSARAAGYNKPNVDYTIFYDQSHPLYCGVGSYFRDERLVVNNNNNNGGGYAITYLGCWDGRTPMHENGHNQGAVQYSAPFSTGSGAHCNDQIDVMCYSDGGDRDQGDFTACADKIHYDCRHDTYFDALPEAGEWLATHWNIGSPLNRFVAFS